MTNFPILVRHSEADSEESFTTIGWKSKVYRISTSPLRFSKTSLHLSDDVFLTRVELKEGRFRNVAEIDPGRMTIGFYSKDGSFAVSGATVENYATSLAYDGSRWDVVTDAPAFSQSLHLSPEAVEKIASAKELLALKTRLATPDGIQALVFPATPAGQQLRKSIEGTLQLAQHAELIGDGVAQLEWALDDLMSAAACLIDEFIEADRILGSEGRKKRHLIALEIEKILWQDPAISTIPKTIDEFAVHFDCSRRRIQQIVEEHFGVGFVALKRFIRLQQVHAALASGDPSRAVTSIALDYEFEHHGRFARYFKEMFGKKPSSLRNGLAENTQRQA